MKRIFSPYRICPIGAHVDHQGGAVLGRTLRLGTTLDYERLDLPEIQLSSDQLGRARFVIGDLDRAHWARYAQAAARLLKPQLGMRAHLSGPLVGAGLSSSASVGLAYLKALADVNGVELAPEELVRLDHALEHEQLGLQNGLLDPLTIVYGKKDALLLMDTATASISSIADPRPATCTWIVAYSGVSRELTRSGFNQRVEECRQAASRLKEGARQLSDVPPGLFDARKSQLPEDLRRRARHYFGEVQRVHLGAQAWQAGDLQLFGRLMNESCESSMQNYGSGSEILMELQGLVSRTQGIYGSRFSGGGYGGCVVGLAERSLADTACAEIAERFSARYPDLPSQVFVAGTGDGLR